MLTKQEKELLSQIACDNETGNHLLGRKRPEGYWEMREEWFVAGSVKHPTKRQQEITEYVRQSTDYEYYQSLPVEQRMF